MSVICMNVTHEVKALGNSKTMDFYITDEIKPDGERWNYETYTWERVESTTSQRYFVEHLAEAKEEDTVNLYINSMGGSVKEALGIYAALRRCPATVNAYIDGFAASAASVIAMAAERVVMPRNTTMMVHNAAWCVYGNPADLRKSADDLDIVNAAMLQSYVTKAGEKLTMEKLAELADGETWLSADDCILYGLADEYAEEEADLGVAAKQYKQATGASRREKSANLPAAMAAAIAAADGSAAASNQQKPQTATQKAPTARKPAQEATPKTCLHNMLAALIN